jgi:uncharacterized membrane protein YraQ (UPF0718 family)
MMKKTTELLRRYRFFLLMLGIALGMLLFDQELGVKVFGLSVNSILGMLGVLPPIFILIGLLDVWVEKETMVKYMGEDSGIIGILLGFFLGAVAAGPLYGAFPVAGVFLNKGSRLANVFIIVGAWSTLKIPMMLFEWAAMGTKFTLIRFVMDIFGVLIIAFAMEKLLTPKDQQAIYELARKMN